MKLCVLFLVMVVLFAGCMGYEPGAKVVGTFVASNGDEIVFAADGGIAIKAGGKEPIPGIVMIDKEEPLTIHVVGPNVSPLVGTKLTFSTARTKIRVEWPIAKIPDVPARATEFRRK